MKTDSSIDRHWSLNTPLTPRLDSTRSPFDIVVVAASMGGIQALSILLDALPANFPAAMAIVEHRPADLHSILERILQRHCALTVTEAENGEHILPGHVYVAPSEWHLIVREDRSFGLRNGNKIQHVRSAGDPLFQTAARSYGHRVVAIVLSGAGGDGSDGVRAVKEFGGLVIAQDEFTSQRFDMPRSAIATGCVDFVLPIELIGPVISNLVKPRESRREPRTRGYESFAERF